MRDGDGWRIKGTKHFISHAQESDFVILFAVTDEPGDGKKSMSTFLVDLDTPGLTVHDGYRNVSHRGYTNAILDFDNCHVPADALLGEEGQGLRPRRHLARQHSPAGRRDPVSVVPSERSTSPYAMPRSVSSSARRSAASRASPSSSPTWRSS